MRLLKIVLTSVVGLTALVVMAPAAGASPNSVLVAALSGANEVPATDPTQEGEAVVSLDVSAGEVCYDVVGDPTAATGMHIHRGATGVNGPIVVNFDVADLNAGENCVTAAASLVSEISGNPAGFYVNVHTTAFPNGVIRGQLASVSVTASLSGAQENPPVATTAAAEVEVSIGDVDQVCADVTATNLTGATAMHIHRGAIGVNGPVVITFDPADINAGENCVDVDPALVTELSNGPGGFYFNIHTAANPGGVIRGQLGVTFTQAPTPTPTPTPAPTTPAPSTPAAPGGGALPTGVSAGNGGQSADASTDSAGLVLALTGAFALTAALSVVVVRRRRTEADI